MKSEEYKLREQEFIARDDALCESTNPRECDCTKCPCKDLCDYLENNSPYK